MIKLQQRSLQKELLDADNIPIADIKLNMQELDAVNRLLGGHAISLQGLNKLLSPTTKKLNICEIGCGGGDNLRAIYEHCRKNNIEVSLIGIDLKPECIAYARERNTTLPASWICSDYKEVHFEKTPDIIFSSLFCHHFSNEQLVDMILWMKRNASVGFFINDLQRHPLAYYSIKWLTKLFSHSYLVKNDAPLSVARGFVKKEWQSVFDKAAIKDYTIEWKWAFRYLIVCKK